MHAVLFSSEYMSFYENHRMSRAADSRRLSSPFGPSAGSNIISMGPFLNRNVSITNIQGFLRSKNCRSIEKIDIDGDYAFITFLNPDCAFQAVKACHGEKFFQSPIQVRQLSSPNHDTENRLFAGDFGPSNDALLRNSLALQNQRNENTGGFPMSGPSFGTLGNFEMPNLSLPPPRRPHLMDELPQPVFVPISSPEHSRNERDGRRQDRTNSKNTRSSTREDKNSSRKTNKFDSKHDHKSSERKSNRKSSHMDRKSTDNSKKVADKKIPSHENQDKINRSSESNKRNREASEDRNEKRNAEMKNKRPRSEASDEQTKYNGKESSPPKITKSASKIQESKMKNTAEVSSVNSAYGQVIASRLEKFDEKQQAYVKLKIEEIFFSVEFGSLPPPAPTVAPASLPTMLNAASSVDYMTHAFNLTPSQGQTSRERRSRF